MASSITQSNFKLAAEASARLEALSQRCEEYCSGPGYRKYALAFSVPLRADQTWTFAFSNYSQDWLGQFWDSMKNGFYFGNSLNLSLRPLTWTAARASYSGARGFLFDEAHRDSEGLFIPVPGPDFSKSLLVLGDYDGEMPVGRALEKQMADALLFVANVMEQVLKLAAEMQGEAPAEVASLTQRQKEVLQGIADGKSAKEIALDLSIEASTVRYLLDRCIAKLDVKTREQAIVKAVTLRIITSPEAQEAKSVAAGVWGSGLNNAAVSVLRRISGNFIVFDDIQVEVNPAR